MKRFFASLIFATVSLSVVASETNSKKKPSFCLQKFCYLIKQRVDPNTKTPVSQLEKNINQVLIDCKDQYSNLINEGSVEFAKEGNMPALEYLFTMKLQAREKRALENKMFLVNTASVVGSMAAGFVLGYYLGKDKAQRAKP